MVETEELVSTIDYQTGGRPSIRYRYMGASGENNSYKRDSIDTKIEFHLPIL